jgi:hypothetical protein
MLKLYNSRRQRALTQVKTKFDFDSARGSDTLAA